MTAELIEVLRPDGKTVSVTQKAFDLVYKKAKYKLLEEREEFKEELDYFTQTREQLEKVKNDDLKDFLTKEEIEFESKATKDELISLIVGD